MNTLTKLNNIRKSDKVDELTVYLTSCSCCKLNTKHKYKYVKYEDDVHIRNNIMFDMKNINFTPDIKWTNCDLYEED